MSTFKIEVGKTYLNNLNEEVKIISVDNLQIFRDEAGTSYAEDGKTRYTSTLNLVAEVNKSSSETNSLIDVAVPNDKDTAATFIMDTMVIDLARHPYIKRIRILLPENHPDTEIQIKRENILDSIQSY